MKTKLLLCLMIFSVLIHAQTQVGQNINGDSADTFGGSSVSLNDDGTVMAVGYQGHDSPGLTDNGLARVYELVNNIWTQKGQGIAGIQGGDNFGEVVSISDSGNILAVSAPSRGTGNVGQVRVYQYDIMLDEWVQIGQNISGSNTNDFLGRTMQLSGDGNRLVLGAPGIDAGSNNRGGITIFEYNSSTNTWDNLLGPATFILGLNNEQFGGGSVSINANGTIIAASSIISVGGNTGNTGYVRTFRENPDGTWNSLGQVIEGANQDSEIGKSLSLDALGNTLAIGEPATLITAVNENRGRVRIYEYNSVSNVWDQVGPSIIGDNDLDRFGTSVSLSSDGNKLIIGADENDANGTESGHVKLFQFSGGVWSQIGQNIEGSASNDFFGRATSISGNGNLIAVGAIGNDDAAIRAGQVRAFELNSLSIDDINLDIDLSFYPNPVTRFLTITSKTIFTDVTIYNMSGQKVLSQSFSITLDLGKLKGGIYLVELTTTDKNKITKKLLKL